MRSIHIYRGQSNPCPTCGEPLDCASTYKIDNPDERAPMPGDATFCTRCFHPAVFNEDLGLRAMTDLDRFLRSDEDFITKWASSAKPRAEWLRKHKVKPRAGH